MHVLIGNWKTLELLQRPVADLVRDPKRPIQIEAFFAEKKNETAKCRIKLHHHTASWKARVPTIGVQSCQRAVPRLGVAAIGKAGSVRRTRYGRSACRHCRLWIVAGEKLDGPHHRSQSEGCETGSVEIAQSLCSTSTSPRTISTRCSKFWTLTRTDMPWMTRMYFPAQSEDHYTRACSRPAQSISGGARMPPCGSAASPH
jgi:hypothetical protein